MREPCLLKYVGKFCHEKFVWRCIDSFLFVKDFTRLGAASVKSTDGIGNAVFVINGDS